MSTQFEQDLRHALATQAAKLPGDVSAKLLTPAAMTPVAPCGARRSFSPQRLDGRGGTRDLAGRARHRHAARVRRVVSDPHPRRRQADTESLRGVPRSPVEDVRSTSEEPVPSAGWSLARRPDRHARPLNDDRVPG